MSTCDLKNTSKFVMESAIYTSGTAENKGIGRSAKMNEAPGQISLPPGLITHLALGWKHGHAVIARTRFFSWGVGDSWRLATGTKDSLPQPTEVNTFPPDFTFDMIVTGDKFGAALGINGKVFIWGSGYAHQPTQIPHIKEKVVFIAAGHRILICVLEDGRAMTFHRHADPRTIFIRNEQISLAAAGSERFIVVCKSGRAYCWDEASKPTQLDPASALFTKCFAYHNNYFLVTDDNQIYCFGGNEDGSLGLGQSRRIMKPTLLANPPFQSQVVQIAIGDDFSLVLTDDGKVYGAGNPDNNRTMISRQNRPKANNEFCYCDLMPYHVTQIAAGCFTSAVLVNGAPPPHLGPPYKSLDEVPIVEMNSLMVVDMGTESVGPNPDEFTNLGIVQGDILEREGKRYKVLGMAQENRVVVMNEEFKAIFLDSKDYINEFTLESRLNSIIETFKTQEGKNVQVDTGELNLMRIGGFKKGDQIPDSDKVIIGSRGRIIYFKDKNDIATAIDVDSIKEIIRNGSLLKKCKFSNGNYYIIEPSEETGCVVCCREFGAGLLVGKVGSLNCIKYASDFGSIRICKEETTTCRKKDFLRPLFDEDMVCYEASVNNDADNSIMVLDLVSTSRGYGTVAGFIPNSDKNIAVWLEENKSNYGAVTLFNKSEIKVIGRLFAPLILENDGISACSDDLIDFHVLPGDDIRYNDKIFRVEGIKDEKVILSNLKSDKENDVERIHLAKDDIDKVEIIHRHMMATAENALIGCALYCTRNISQVLPKI